MDVPALRSSDLINPLQRTQRWKFSMQLDRFERYEVRALLSSLKQCEKDLDELKARRDKRNLLAKRMETARLLQRIRVAILDLSRIEDQAECPEDRALFSSKGERQRKLLIQRCADLLNKHPEVQLSARDQDDILLTKEEKDQGYAHAADEISREKDRIASNEDLLLRVETIKTDVGHIAGLMDQFWTLLEAQGRPVATIEANIAQAEEDVVEGAEDLSMALQYKTNFYPLIGAVVGGVIAGPIGALSGGKVGAVCLAIGSLLGYKGGNVMRRRQLLELSLRTKPRERGDIPQEDPSKYE